jgi:hypothetical protein
MLSISKGFVSKALNVGSFHLETRNARWFILKPKIPNLGRFRRAFEW